MLLKEALGGLPGPLIQNILECERQWLISAKLWLSVATQPITAAWGVPACEVFLTDFDTNRGGLDMVSWQTDMR